MFLSYASQDAEAARRISDALRAAGIEVWFDQSELRGGDAWDAAIRRQIKACALFIPVISAAAHDRVEGYFRLEWKLAVDRSHLIAPDQTFLLPVVIDETPPTDERIPDRFRELQWSRLPAGETPQVFVERVLRLLSPAEFRSPSTTRPPAAPDQAPLEPAPSRAAARLPRRAMLLAAAVAVLAVGYIALDRIVLSKRPAAGPSSVASTGQAGAPAERVIPPQSIAVLPFTDMSEKKDQEYFSDGLTEELLDLLAEVPNLRVPARTSSFYFKGKQTTIADIAEELGVANILEGSVRKSGHTLRITAQLIRADNGYHVWSETYDRPLNDIFKVQDEIAGAVVKALKVSLLGAGMPKAPPAANQQAYALFLQARSLHYRGTHADAGQGVAYMEKALKLDPDFAPAWAGLADSLVYDFVAFGGSYQDVRSRAFAAAEKAIRLDPKLSEAHLAMGRTLGELDWNWVAADPELKQALELDPNDVLALGVSSGYALFRDRLDEAKTLADAAAARDVVGWGVYTNLGDVEIRRGRFAEAEAAYRKATELNATAAGPYFGLGLALLGRRQPAQALAAWEREADPGLRQYGLALGLWALGRRSEADQALQVLESTYAATMAEAIGSVYACRNQLDRSFSWLERAYRQHDGALPGIRADPCVNNLRSDGRYAALLRKVNLPE